MYRPHHIRGYRPDDWPRVSAFLAAHWAPRHAILNPALFEWQYRGFVGASRCAAADGPDCNDRPAALLVERDDEVLGFLGLIHGSYQVASPKAANESARTAHPIGETLPGAALATWVVDPRYRQVGLGIQLLAAAEERWPVIVCLGVNAAAGACFRRRNYQELAALERWVAPLNARAYARLCSGAADAKELAHWSNQVRDGRGIAPVRVGSGELSAAWEQSTRTDTGWAVQGLHRTERFWQTRYLGAVGYTYMTWRLESSGPIAIGRIEVSQPHGDRVLRLIELIPARPASWCDSSPDEALQALLSGVLAWAADEGCAAVDFQVTPGLLNASLSAAALRPQRLPASADPTTSLAALFQPLSFDKPPINVYWRTPASATATPWYFPKSDGDMDRPYAM